jgi:hypothetical protein
MLVSTTSSRRHCAAPEAALEAISHHDGPLLLDLDETAYLSNSTEDFLDSAQPGLAALLLLRLLDAIRPWRWTGGEATRDFWRVRLVSTFIPWIWILWRRRVKWLAAQFANHSVLNAVARRTGPTLFVTAGFQPIVAPLIAALGFPEAQIIACRLTSTEDRLCGKFARAVNELGEDTVAASVVLTDSLEDLPLLDRCARPLWTVWENARYRRALTRIYMPGQYLTQVKRPGERYILHGIILEDFALWVLCSILHAPFPIAHVIGLLALLISFWAIYELGYVDNDRVAQRHEEDPKLSDTFGGVEIATPPLLPWAWAFVFGFVAVFLLDEPGKLAFRDVITWTTVLLATHFVFWVYNRLDKRSRIWLYPVLQLSRCTSFAVLVPIGLAASLALGAHTLARWIPYYIYRTRGKDWPEMPFFLTRLLFYILLLIIFVISTGLASIVTPTTFLLLLWSAFRARKELRETVAGIHRVDRNEHRSE